MCGAGFGVCGVGELAGLMQSCCWDGWRGVGGVNACIPLPSSSDQSHSRPFNASLTAQVVGQPWLASNPQALADRSSNPTHPRSIRCVSDDDDACCCFPALAPLKSQASQTRQPPSRFQGRRPVVCCCDAVKDEWLYGESVNRCVWLGCKSIDRGAVIPPPPRSLIAAAAAAAAATHTHTACLKCRRPVDS